MRQYNNNNNNNNNNNDDDDGGGEDNESNRGEEMAVVCNAAPDRAHANGHWGLRRERERDNERQMTKI